MTRLEIESQSPVTS